MRGCHSLHLTRTTPSRHRNRCYSPLRASGTKHLRSLHDLLDPQQQTFVNELPGDADPGPRGRQVIDAAYSFVRPTPAGADPHLVAFSPECAALLGLDPAVATTPEFPLIFSGAAPLPGAAPYAQCYGGHQFGSWAGQLGDGRAITLGETVNADTGARFDVQLKGAGRTPYSRRGDGRAVMRSSIREFIGSEAMHHLGVPTTRALSLVATDERVVRDMFYNGNTNYEPGAVLCRVAPSLLRFGSLQLPAARSDDQLVLVKSIADYFIRHHLSESVHPSDPDRYAAMLREVTARTASLVAAWQTLGFVHGVLNTDNMSLLGLTLDYGPFGFLDGFEPGFTPNLSDLPGRRYAFREQPGVAQWNLVKLGEALVVAGLLDSDQVEAALQPFASELKAAYGQRMATKMGFKDFAACRSLSQELLAHMAVDGADFTLTWRALSSIPDDGGAALPGALLRAIDSPGVSDARLAEWGGWVEDYAAALRLQGMDEGERTALQDSVNPLYVPRQHVMQSVIHAADGGEYGPVNELMAVLRAPYTEQSGAEAFAQRPPAALINKPGISMLSCSS